MGNQTNLEKRQEESPARKSCSELEIATKNSIPKIRSGVFLSRK